jgi:hypothetical protein
VIIRGPFGLDSRYPPHQLLISCVSPAAARTRTEAGPLQSAWATCRWRFFSQNEYNGRETIQPTAMQTITETAAPAAPRARSTKKVVLITLAVILGCAGIAAATGALWVKHTFYPSPIQPVSLTSDRESGVRQQAASPRRSRRHSC